VKFTTIEHYLAYQHHTTHTAVDGQCKGQPEIDCYHAAIADGLGDTQDPSVVLCTHSLY